MGDHISIKHLIPVGLVAAATLAFGTAQASAVTTANWHMNDSANPVTDSSGNGHDGTAHGGVTFGVTGSVGTALHFDGTDGTNVTVPNATGLEPGMASQFTIEGYVNTGHLPAGTTSCSTNKTKDFDIVRKGTYSAGNEDWKMELECNPNSNTDTTHVVLNCGFQGSNTPNSEVQVASTTLIPINQTWHYVECVDWNNAGTWQITANTDGHLTTTNANVGTVSNNNNLIFGAHDTTSGDEYNGKLDDFDIIK